MKEEELAYLAGFIDGEGYIGISKNSSYGELQISITNTNEDIIRLIAKWFKGSVRLVEKKENHKDCWRFGVYSEDAVTLLKAVYPYLFVKREQAYIGLEFQKLIGKKGKPVSPENIKSREELHRQVCILNKTGGRKI